MPQRKMSDKLKQTVKIVKNLDELIEKRDALRVAMWPIEDTLHEIQAELKEVEEVIAEVRGKVDMRLR